jgi:CRISPR/Cas system-associated protein Cas10 (large subunit of type III CRISPR-Cas system)
MSDWKIEYLVSALQGFDTIIVSGETLEDAIRNFRFHFEDNWINSISKYDK